MPEGSPFVGEIWQMNTVGASPTQGVVTEISQGSVTLLSQIGRNASVPLSSFLLTWTYIRTPAEHHCTTQGCDHIACVQIREQGEWSWVCVNHIRRGVDIRFEPGSESPPFFDQCPSCGAPRTIASEAAEIGGHRVHLCKRCGQRWVILVGRGDHLDGPWMAEAIQGIVMTLEGLKFHILQCLMGTSVGESLVGTHPLREMTPIPVNQSNRYGAGQVVILAQGPIPYEENPPPGAPAVGSIWWDKDTRLPARVLWRGYEGGGKFLLSIRESQKSRDISLDRFQEMFNNIPPTIDTGPIEIGDLWSLKGTAQRIIEISGVPGSRSITLQAGKDFIPVNCTEETLRIVWDRVRLKSSLERLLEDDLF